MKLTSYTPDISILNEFTFFLTWLSVPRLTNHVSTLYVDVRLFGHSPLCNGLDEESPLTWFAESEGSPIAALMQRRGKKGRLPVVGTFPYLEVSSV